MGQLIFCGKKYGKTFVAIGTLHYLSQHSIQWTAFTGPIEVSYPIDRREVDRAMLKLPSGRWNDTVVRKGRVRTAAQANIMIRNACPMPARRQWQSLPRDMPDPYAWPFTYLFRGNKPYQAANQAPNNPRSAR